MPRRPPAGTGVGASGLERWSRDEWDPRSARTPGTVRQGRHPRRMPCLRYRAPWMLPAVCGDRQPRSTRPAAIAQIRAARRRASRPGRHLADDVRIAAGAAPFSVRKASGIERRRTVAPSMKSVRSGANPGHGKNVFPPARFRSSSLDSEHPCGLASTSQSHSPELSTAAVDSPDGPRRRAVQRLMSMKKSLRRAARFGSSPLDTQHPCALASTSPGRPTELSTVAVDRSRSLINCPGKPVFSTVGLA